MRVVVAFGLVLGAACYVFVGYVLGNNFLLNVSARYRPVFELFPWAIAAGSVALFVTRSLSIRSEYLAYRRSADFRVWIRGMLGNGLHVAHAYYAMGWRNRAVGEAFSLATTYAGMSVGLLALSHAPDEAPIGRGGWIALGASAAALMTVPLVGAAVTRLWVIFRPEYGLADLCTRIASTSASKDSDEEGRPVVHRPGAWREKKHEDSFKIAKLIEWSVRRGQGRYAPHHYNELVLAARRLAQSFRLNALATESERGLLGEKKFLALQLTTGRNPMDFVGRIGELTAGEPDPPELPRARAARVVEAVSSAINVHWPALKIVAVVLALVLLVGSGKLVDAVGLLK
ncbi:MAG TPA: hypothetical protein VF821_22390 [Lentzea sp.]